MDKLKRCPCCNGDVKVFDIVPCPGVYIVGCSNRLACGLNTGTHDSLALAAVAWNLRADGWISVEDLPDHRGPFDLWDSSEEERFCGYDFRDGKFYRLSRGGCPYPTDMSTVSHYMKAPKGPK